MVDALRTTTLGDLRRRCGLRLNDLYMLEATKVGTTDTLVDSLNIPTGNESLNDCQMVFRSGAYAGTKVRVTTTSQSNGTISFTPAVAGNVASGTTADVFNKRNSGFTLNEYKTAINMAIDESYPLAKQVIVTTPAVYDSSTGAITMPTTISEVYQVLYQEPSTLNWYPIGSSDAYGYYGWQVNDYDSTLILNGPDRYRIDGYTVKVVGYGKHPLLDADTDTTTLHPDYVESSACYRLCMMGLNRDTTGIRAKQVLTFQQEAETRKVMVWTRRDPESVVLRQW